MTRATIWAICLIIAGTALCFGALYYVMHAKDGSDDSSGSKKSDYDRRANLAVVPFCFGGVLGVFGTVIGVIEIIRHFLR